jgi:Ca-activated chloride channel family protein
MRPRIALLTTMTCTLWAALIPAAAAQAPPAAASEAPVARFRSSVNLVSVSAVVRDKKGRVLSTLAGDEFEVYDAGQRRPVLAFHSSQTAAASVAILVDGSGSMVLGEAHAQARQVSAGILAKLSPGRDAAALLTFDTRLLTVCDFTRDFAAIHTGFTSIEAFGSTSLYDAIAGSASVVAERVQNRRAVIVLTDGADTTSAYTPAQVAWIASTIDVPIYVFAVGDGAVARDEETEPRGALVEIARATGGDFFVATTPEQIAAGVARVAEELRHQYVFAFESPGASGLRRLEVRTRRRDLTVTARRWYQAGE